jgi:hypothetical protein
VVDPQKLLTATFEDAKFMVFYTKRSFIERCAEFAIHQIEEGALSYTIVNIFVAFANFDYITLSDLFTALRHISEFIQPPDSLNSIRAMLSRNFAHQTHPPVYELCWSLCQNRIKMKLMWIPFHVGVVEI